MTTHPDPCLEAVRLAIIDAMNDDDGWSFVQLADAALSAAAPFSDAERVREDVAHLCEECGRNKRVAAVGWPLGSVEQIELRAEAHAAEHLAADIRSIPISPREPVGDVHIALGPEQIDEALANAPHLDPLNRAESDEAEDYRCTHGHDKCSEMYAGPECPYCIKVPAPTKTKDEAWGEAAYEAAYGWVAKSTVCAIVYAADLARFGGDPGEKIESLEAYVFEHENKASDLKTHIGCQAATITALRAQLTEYLDLNAEHRARIAELEALLTRASSELDHAAIFIRGRVKMHEDGCALYDALRDDIRAALQPKGSDGE